MVQNHFLVWLLDSWGGLWVRAVCPDDRICRNNMIRLREDFNEIFLESNWRLAWQEVDLCDRADETKHFSVSLPWSGHLKRGIICLALVRSHLWRKTWGWSALSCNIPELREPSETYMECGLSGGIPTCISSSSSYWVSSFSWRRFERQNMETSLCSPPLLAPTRGKCRPVPNDRQGVLIP